MDGRNVIRSVLLSIGGLLLVAGVVIVALLPWPTSREPEQTAIVADSDTAQPADVVENTAAEKTETPADPDPAPAQEQTPETPAVTPTPAEDEKTEPAAP